MKRITPLFDRVLVQRVKPATKVGGILLPETAASKTNEATVVAVGKGAYTTRSAHGAVGVALLVVLAHGNAHRP